MAALTDLSKSFVLKYLIGILTRPKLSLASLPAVEDGKFYGYVPKHVRYFARLLSKS